MLFYVVVCMHVVLGQIRTACCQARLLMRQKLKQYIGLVDVAEKMSGERQTTAQDLQVSQPCSCLCGGCVWKDGACYNLLPFHFTME